MSIAKLMLTLPCRDCCSQASAQQRATPGKHDGVHLAVAPHGAVFDARLSFEGQPWKGPPRAGSWDGAMGVGFMALPGLSCT